MTLALTIDGPIARLRISRAEKRNAFTQAMWEELPVLLAEAAASPARVLVLQAAEPGVFCAGADIGEFTAGARDPAWRAANQAAIRRAQHELTRLAKPTIALIEGDCVGGGCGLAIACDMRVAAPAARFGITPAKLGLVYSLHDTKLLVDLVGPGQARRILYTGQLIDAAEAARIGLVEIVAEGAAAAVDDLAHAIASASAHSQRGTKAIVRRILDGQAEDDTETLAMFADAFTGPDFAEGAAAFADKRAPRFVG